MYAAIPVYYPPLEEAARKDEAALWRDSYNINMDCRNFIQDKAMTAEGKTPVSWNFPTMPSEEWKNGVGSALTAYAAGTGDWDGVVTAFVDGWASEYALANG